jgi:DNA-binding transcriptional regulator GbsR (MarR family)
MDRDETDILNRYMVDACVKVANNRGLCDAIGVLRGTLFLSEGPVSMDELVEETGYSKSTVSANMSTLETQGLVKRVVMPGDKRYYYVPVTDPDSLKEVLITNMKQEMQVILSAMNRTEVDLKACPSSSAAALERIERARRFYHLTNRLLDLIYHYNTEELIDILEQDFERKTQCLSGESLRHHLVDRIQ